jgi:hypothetical protein
MIVATVQELQELCAKWERSYVEERGRRWEAEKQVRRLREITKDKRDFMAICEQLEAECVRLQSQVGDHWKHMHDQQVARKRALKERYDHLRAAAVEVHRLLDTPIKGDHELDLAVLELEAELKRA